MVVDQRVLEGTRRPVEAPVLVDRGRAGLERAQQGGLNELLREGAVPDLALDEPEEAALVLDQHSLDDGHVEPGNAATRFRFGGGCKAKRLRPSPR